MMFKATHELCHNDEPFGPLWDRKTELLQFKSGGFSVTKYPPERILEMGYTLKPIKALVLENK